MRERAVEATVAVVDWSVFKDLYRSRSRGRLLEEMQAGAPPGDAQVAAEEGDFARALESAPAPDRRERLREHVTAHVRAVLGFSDSAAVNSRQGLLDMGMNSLMAVELRNRVQRRLGRNLPATLVFDHPSIDAITDYIYRDVLRYAVPEAASPANRETVAAGEADAIAIVGMGCRFPGGADSPDAYWNLLRQGQSAVTEIPPDRWDVDEFYDPNPETPGTMYTRWGAFLQDGVDRFDAAFFGISPREAADMDPQQRLLLEVAWEALEHGGIAPTRLAGTETGVFIGINNNEYATLPGHLDDPARIYAYSGTGNALSVASGRLSYVLGVHGPSLVVDTACSSSLVAIQLACRSLQNRECTLALAGGVSLIVSPSAFVMESRNRMFSADGRCKTFDAAADGFVRGEGCGVVVLKRLSAAVADGDCVLAVIRSAAVNQDGHSSSLTAPHGPAQQSLLRKALQQAAVDPSEIDYVEAHGTGTALGDPIEVQALAAVLGDRGPDRPLMIGAVKTNIGHLEAAAGVAGLIKVVLSLQRGAIPPHLHFKTLNPHIALEGRSIVIPTELTPWGSGNRAAEETPIADEVSEPHWRLMLLSAETDARLETLTDELVTFLERRRDVPLAEVARALRSAHAGALHRRMLVCRDRDEAIGAWRARDAQRVLRGLARTAPRPVVFMFPGLGDQHAGMAADLYHAEPRFRQHVDRCADVVSGLIGVDLREVLFTTRVAAEASAAGAGAIGGGSSPSIDLRRMLGERGVRLDSDTPLERTTVAHTALFVTEYALAQLWMQWGVRPRALIGYSLGEYVAACLAGVFSLDDALRLVARRAEMIESAPPGAMLAVPLSQSDVEALIEGEVAVGASNGPLLTVVSGNVEAVGALETRLRALDVVCGRVQTARAVHSPMMEPLAAAFADLVGSVGRNPPRIPFISNVTGTWISASDAIDPHYWARHMCRTVRFSAGMSELMRDRDQVLLEVGPGQALSSFAVSHSAEPMESDVFASLPHRYDRRSEHAHVLSVLGRLWLTGVKVDWPAFDPAAEDRSIGLVPRQKRRLAGVSSFGFSGTNAHVIVEEGPAVAAAVRGRGAAGGAAGVGAGAVGEERGGAAGGGGAVCGRVGDAAGGAAGGLLLQRAHGPRGLRAPARRGRGRRHGDGRAVARGAPGRAGGRVG